MTRVVAARGGVSSAFGAFVPLVAFGLVLCESPAAFASTTYPTEIEAHLALGYVPKCALCHDDADAGPTDTPFAKSMLARGLSGGADLASLDAALDAMKKDRVDSDGDGQFDLDELSYGGDPNHADVAQGAPGPAPMYGCAVSGGKSDASIAIVALAIAAACARKRWAR